MKIRTKVITLALAPLIIAMSSKMAIDAKSRTASVERQISDQYQLLIHTEQQGVANLVDAASRLFQQNLNNPNLSKEESREIALEAARGMKFEDDNYIFIFDHDGLMLVSDSPRGENISTWDRRDEHGVFMIQDMIQIAKRQGSGYYDYYWHNPETNSVERKYSFVENIPGTDLVIGAGVYVSEIDEIMEVVSAEAMEELRREIYISLLISLITLIGLGAVATRFSSSIIRPIKETTAAMREISEGEGDLTKRIEINNNDEVGDLAKQFNNFAEKMRKSLLDVRKNANSVSAISSEIASGSEELAARIEQSASNIQETTASMEEITATVGHTADSAAEVNRLALHSTKIANEGAEAMKQVQNTMEAIKTSGGKISHIIAMMDDIAFQTNILALNASVEAARAGDQGRGFSVVAQEVRNLSQRSAEASRDIRGLIEGTVKNTDEGSIIVNTAGEKMKEIVSSIAKVSESISEISSGATEQQAGIVQVNTAMSEMDSVTQENSTLIQQSASAADGMRSTAQKMGDLVNSFILGDEDEESQSSPKLGAPMANMTSNRPVRSEPVKTTAPKSEEDDWSEF